MALTRTKGTCLGLAGGLMLGLLLSALPVSSDESDVLIEEFFEPVAWLVQQIEARSVNEVGHRKLLEGAYEGMLSKLDRHSAYWPPSIVREFEADLAGEFGGLGIQITFDNRKRVIRVEQPIAGTPAARQGVLPGDLIVRVREGSTGKVTEVETLESVHDVLSVLRGRPGSNVTITVMRGEGGETEDITITRELIKIPGVRAVEMVDPERKLGYVYIPYFSDPMMEELKQAIAELRAQGARGLILDLRLNPGGLLDAAEDLVDLFLDGGTIVTVKGRRTEEQVVHEAHRRGTDRDTPLVLLVNRASASGSEIVAAALRDHKRAVVVGERTYGKASVQQVMDNPYDDSAIKITVARYYTPNGQLIEGHGVPPDVEVKLSDEDTRKLYAYLNRKTEYPPPPPNSPAPADDGQEGDEPPEEFRDIQLDRAVEVLNELLAGTRRPGQPVPDEGAVALTVRPR